jgi:hypothetical protein
MELEPKAAASDYGTEGKTLWPYSKIVVQI